MGDETVGMPSEASLFDFQIGGHKHGKGKDKWGVLKHQNGNILKPLRTGDSRSVKELEFYENVFKNHHTDPILSELKDFLPDFRNTWETSLDGKAAKYLCLEDICASYKKPSVLDVKIGSQTHAPDASKEKIHFETSKSPGGILLGFRVIGMKVYNTSKKSYVTWDKYFGRQLMPDTILPAFQLFLTDHQFTINCCILAALIHKLLNLLKWFRKQRIFAFYSSSLLLTYEGDTNLWIDWAEHNNIYDYFSSQNFYKEALNITNCECGFIPAICSKLQTNCSLYRIAMIDFAHTFATTEEDTNYIKGLTSLLESFKELLKIYKEKIGLR